jgi:cytochrome c-type biogenesis protein CcmE
MKPRIIIGGIVITVFVIVGALSFLESNIQYVDFKGAQKTGKKVQVKGQWNRNREYGFDSARNQFSFYMKDDNDVEVKVLLDGAKPNNFEVATSVVAKGRYSDGYFHATEVLTKCPSKYEGQSQDLQ